MITNGEWVFVYYSVLEFENRSPGNLKPTDPMNYVNFSVLFFQNILDYGCGITQDPIFRYIVFMVMI